MKAIIFIGLQAAGKSTFYQEKFSDTHIRINLDMLKTRHREQILFNACLEAKQPFVIDNTNPTIEDRKRYIPIAKEKEFQIIGYYFQADIEKCKLRNNKRDRFVPVLALLVTYKKLQIPTYQEGFDQLYCVSIDKNNSFLIEEWNAV